MKNFTFLIMMLLVSVGYSYGAGFPVNFESGTYTFTNFDGGAASVIDNPQSSGINTSAKVVQMIKNAGQVWAGSKLALASTVDFTTNQVFTMKVYSPRVGVPVLFKLENTDGSVFVEKTVNTTVANTWETLSFDFSGSTSGVFNGLVFIFQNGTAGDGSANWTFLFDDIEFIPSTAPALILPIDFEAGPYGFTDFDGGAATVIANPKSSGINTSAKVAQIVRNGGATWAGSKLVLNSKIDFSAAATFSMKVFSTRAGVPVLFKLEGDGGAATELSVKTTVANEWETMTWNFSGQPSNKFNTLVFMFDFGAVGDGSANSTFLFDDVKLIDSSGGLAQIDLPLNFEGSTVNYALTDFGGNATVLGADPANAANTVAVTTKTAGAETWAGTTIGTALGFATRIPLTQTSTKISVLVYSPASGITVRMKAEDHKDETLTVETEAKTTIANGWERLTFDFSSVATGTNPYNPNTSFDKVSIFFNFGAVGSGAVYYWDDVLFESVTAVAQIQKTDILITSKNSQIVVSSTEDQTNGIIDVYDLAGRKIISHMITGNRTQMNINVKGIFIVRVSDSAKNLIKVKKIVME